MFYLSKEFEFAAAHRLIDGYEGKCSSLHGHNYKIKVVLEAYGIDEKAIAYDFHDFKVIESWIDYKWDHATLVSGSDEELIKFLEENNQKFYIFPLNPTCEIIATQLTKVIQAREEKILPKHIKLNHIIVKESDKTECVYFVERNDKPIPPSNRIMKEGDSD